MARKVIKNQLSFIKIIANFITKSSYYEEMDKENHHGNPINHLGRISCTTKLGDASHIPLESD